MVCPGLTGQSAMRALADDDSLALPIVAHPAYQGALVTRPSEGIGHGLLFGTLARLAGADSTVYPNFGGRFGFSREECMAIARGASEELGALRPVLPTPGGGIDLTTIPKFASAYGRDVMYLVGGSLYRQGPDLTENCREFRRLVAGAESAAAE
jgi:ribulose-bisphosphate carboxylase large chain